jgi:heme-degrading monooxygenase HmoA
MFARISTYHGAPGRVKEGSRAIDEITPELRQIPGYHSGYLLVDGKSGKAITISLWASEEEASQIPPSAPLRDRIARALGASESPTVEIFEVGDEISHRPEGARFARVSEYRGSPEKIQEGIRTAKGAESTLKQMQGFHQAYIFVDRKGGYACTMTFWESEEALHRSSSPANPIRDDIARSFGATEKPTVEIYEVASHVPQRARKAA